MDVLTVFIILGVIYSVLLFFDTFFKTCAHYPYIQFLKNTGFEIGFLRLKWTTTAFNRIILRLGTGRSKILNYWFDTGVYVSGLLLPIAVALLIVANYQLISNRNNSETNHQLVLEPLLPGYNLPISELGYYALSLLISSVVHELGHALAAVREDVQVIDVGVSVLGCIPMAYVTLNSERLAQLLKGRALRVLCAGVWHNIVTAFITGILYISLPILLLPLYTTGNGVAVTDITGNSPLTGARGLMISDIIVNINGCPVTDENTWQDCLSKARTIKPGYCISTDLAHELDESGHLTQMSDGTWECCASRSQQNLCFEYLELPNGVVELPPHMCLPARKILESSVAHCHQSTIMCPIDTHCVRPLLHNTTALLELKRKNDQPVLYVGHPSDVFLTISVSSYVPKYSFPGCGPPAIINRLLKYLLVFSAGLAILNILPCIYFDGQHIISCLISIVFKGKAHRRNVHTVTTVSVIIGTILLMFNFIFTLWNVFYRK